LKQTFKKRERLHSKKLIGRLFTGGDSFFIYPFKVVFFQIPQAGDVPAQVMISVSKKKLKSAVKRNRVKRLFREAYRKNKWILAAGEGQNTTIVAAFIYVADTIMEYRDIEKKIILILQRLKSKDEKVDS
jgi:ribonuclease P protein component